MQGIGIYIIFMTSAQTQSLIPIRTHKQLRHGGLVSGSPFRSHPFRDVEPLLALVHSTHSAKPGFCRLTEVVLQRLHIKHIRSILKHFGMHLKADDIYASKHKAPDVFSS